MSKETNCISCGGSGEKVVHDRNQKVFIVACLYCGRYIRTFKKPPPQDIHSLSPVQKFLIGFASVGMGFLLGFELYKMFMRRRLRPPLLQK